MQSAVLTRSVRHTARTLVVGALFLALGVLAAFALLRRSAVGGSEPLTGFAESIGSGAPSPRWLSATGLYRPGGTAALDAAALPYSPTYPLWTDGAGKRRWIRLPEGQSIDASNPDDFVFPAGTKFFKEFRFAQAVETRVIELTPEGWRFATYVWRRDGRDAELAPVSGVARAAEISNGVFHDVPATDDCAACHESRKNPILGFTALQLSPLRDPLAPHAEAPPRGSLDLPELVRRGLLTGLPRTLLQSPPRIRAESATGRAARGYLYGNCAHCHNSEGPLSSLGLDFDFKVARAQYDSLSSTAINHASHFQPAGASGSLRIARGEPDRSVLLERMASRDAVMQMPPLGTHVVDAKAVELLHSYVSQDLQGPANKKEQAP